jgi:hypothetical protein
MQTIWVFFQKIMNFEFDPAPTLTRWTTGTRSHIKQKADREPTEQRALSLTANSQQQKTFPPVQE